MEIAKIPEKLSGKIRELFSDKYVVVLTVIIVFHFTLNIIWQYVNTAPPTWDSAGHLVVLFD